MVDIAEEDKDHASRDFLFGFVREQVEEESTAKEIVEQLKNYGECMLVSLTTDWAKDKNNGQLIMDN